MSQLVLFVRQDRLFTDGGTEQFPCNLRDELTFSNRIGDQILIANMSTSFAQGFIALGKLAGFRTKQGDTIAVIDAVQTFPEVVASRDAEPAKPGMFELSDAIFEDVIARAVTGTAVDEAGGFFLGAPAEDSFSANLAEAYRNRCAFSGIQTSDGAAFIIQPIEHGGRFHISNFLFLDPELGELFAQFAWTVGPNLQIIIDAGAITADISDTVNRVGRLLLPVRSDAEPDPASLAWHFDQFTKRIAAGR